MITRPVRERPADQVASMVQQGLRRTGYDEVALTSLSTADFSGIEDVVSTAMDDEVGCGNVSVSLPSLRVRSEEHTSELQSLMRISYAVFCLKKKNTITR